MNKKDQGESKTNGLTSPLNDVPTELTQEKKLWPIWSHPRWKKVQEDHDYIEVNRNLSLWPPAQKISALSTKLIGHQF